MATWRVNFFVYPVRCFDCEYSGRYRLFLGTDTAAQFAAIILVMMQQKRARISILFILWVICVWFIVVVIDICMYVFALHV